MRTLQAKVVQRFMDPMEFETFLAKYQANRKVYRLGDRSKTLALPVTSQEAEMVKDYLAATEPIKVLAEKYGVSYNTFMQKVSRVATKVLYQNKEILKFS